MRSKFTDILEGLHRDKSGSVNEAPRRYSYDEVDFPSEDILVIDNRRGLEDAISLGVEKKYSPLMSKYGKIEVGVDIDLTDDDKRELVDVADAIHINFYLNDPVEGSSVRDVLRAIMSLKAFKGYKPKYDSRSDVYYIDAEGNEDCDGLLVALVKDGVIQKNKKLYHVELAADIERTVLARRQEDREDMVYQEREYYRDRL